MLMVLSIFLPRTRPRNTHQPQRIHPPRRVGRVLVAVQPAGQFDRVGGQVAASVGIVVAMAVVVKPAFFVVILALKTQRVADVGDVEGEYVAVNTVVGGPDDVAAAAGQFLGRAEVVKLVVIGLCVLTFAV